MRTLLMVLAISLALSGCKTYEYGPHEFEQGSIVSTGFTPPSSDVILVPNIDSNGNLNGFHIIPIYIPEEFKVTIRCPHGTFAIDGRTASVAHATWEKVRPGDRVVIEYAAVNIVKRQNDKIISSEFVRWHTFNVEIYVEDPKRQVEGKW